MKPWERYADAAPEAGPWSQYATDEQPKPKVASLADLPKKGAPITRTEKLIKGARDPLDGGAQLLTNMLPAGVVKAGNAVNNWLADKTGLVGRLPEGGVDQQVKVSEAEYQQRREQAGESGFDGYRMLGNVLSPVNVAAAAKLPQAASLAGRIGIGAGYGGGSAALAPVAGDDYWGEKGKQVMAGVAGGGVTPLATGALSRIISPKASINPQLQLLRKEGVRPTIGQSLGGWWNAAEEKLTSVPIMGDAIASARRGANTGFETAAHNRALRPVGQSLPKGVTGRDAVNVTEGALRDTYTDVLGKIGAITPDAQFNQKVASLQTMVNGLAMPKAEKAKFASALSDVRQSIDGNGVITSDAFKVLESSLGADARKLGASTNIYEGKLSPAVKQLQAELRDMLNRQSGAHASELKGANAGWANFKRVQNASSKLGADDGSFTPAQFQNAVRAMDKSKDKGAFARGSALGQDLGDAGKSIMGNKVPDSGTTTRLLMGGGALGSYVLNPAIPIGLLGGAAMYSKPVQALLTGAAALRPQSAKAIAEALKKRAAGAVPLGAQVGLGLLNQ